MKAIVLSKKSLGQFFTTNVSLILKGFEQVVGGKSIIDPFAGNQDLLKWAKTHQAKQVSGYDIDLNYVDDKTVHHNDSLLIIPKGDFVLTNPPYLAKNKMTKEQKDTYMLDDYEDFYLLAIKRIINAEYNEGIIIIPVNFFSAENSDKLRKEFLNLYLISQVNYFKFQVFEDTTYNVVSFHFLKKTEESSSQILNFSIFSDETSAPEAISFELEEKFQYRIAGKELHKFDVKTLKCIRLTEEYLEKNSGQEEIDCFFNDKNTQKTYYVNEKTSKLIKNNLVLFNCIDTSASEDAWIKAENIQELGKDALVGKISSRNIAYVILDNVSIKTQKEAIDLFNLKLNSLRKKYKSLFLTNFRDNDRKRISFEFCYKLFGYCVGKVNEKQLSVRSCARKRK